MASSSSAERKYGDKSSVTTKLPLSKEFESITFVPTPNVVPITFSFNSPVRGVLLRFARALAASIGRQPHDVLPKGRLVYLCDVYKDSELDHELINHFDTFYRYLFVSVHYIIERTWYAIQLRRDDPYQKLLPLIADEDSMIHFVALCNLNWHRLRLESGVTFANNQALLEFAAQQEIHLAFYGTRDTFHINLGSSEAYSVSLPNDYDFGTDELAFSHHEATPYWLFMQLIHGALRRDWRIDTLLDVTTNQVALQRLREPAQWSGWMDAAVYTAVTQAYSMLGNTVATFSTTMSYIKDSDVTMLQFANLVGVTFHLQQFQQKMYKRSPVVVWLQKQQEDLVAVLKS